MWDSTDLASPVATPPIPAEFSVLDADVAADLALWRERWQGWPDREIMAHPDFVRRFARPGDQVRWAEALPRSGTLRCPNRCA